MGQAAVVDVEIRIEDRLALRAEKGRLSLDRLARFHFVYRDRFKISGRTEVAKSASGPFIKLQLYGLQAQEDRSDHKGFSRWPKLEPQGAHPERPSRGVGASRTYASRSLNRSSLALFAREHSVFDVYDLVSKFEHARIVRYHQNGTASLLGNGREYRRGGMPIGSVE